MAANERKRKRENGELATSSEARSDDESHTSTQEPIVLEDETYKVIVLREKAKRTKFKGFGDVKIEQLPGSGKEVCYQVRPGAEWDSMRKYKHFVGEESHAPVVPR